MTVLCDWCRHSAAFYTRKKKCGMDYAEMKGRDEDCPDFEPDIDMVVAFTHEDQWQEFVEFYGMPHPNIVQKFRPNKSV